MAPLKLLCMPLSTCTKRVIALLEELQVPYEVVTIDLTKGEQKRPEYVKLQPFGKIPVLEDPDTGITIFESRSILRYLANKYQDKAGSLVGTDAKSRALVDNWLEAEGQNFNPPAGNIVFERVFKAWRGQAADEAAVQKELPKLEAVLDAYETILAQRPYLAGDDFSIADLSHLPYLSLLMTAAGVSDPVNKRPHVKAWWDRISSRPTWQKVSQMK
ncbi:hypothetical protein WJX72_001273 [[Myrmecia] bisecta]|uniref:glutathione transferase n=1 Tax=[Myrmecia] bisecta TaxID=41462 RepID=A0AAW1PGH2_9CHLO